jgi:CBS domain-containing protein
MTTHTVGEFMTTSPHTIGADQPLALAHEKMRTEGIRHLPVLSARKIVGILSDRDLRFLESFKDIDPRVVRVEEAMSVDVYAVDANTSLSEAATTMAERKLGSAVVMRGGDVVGVLTTTDICRALAAVLR